MQKPVERVIIIVLLTLVFTNVAQAQQAVDLGLSVKWASCNLGATKPEEYGGYYAWGETETKSDYSWSTYKWCNGSDETLTKYNPSSSYGRVDNKTVLDMSDDVANIKLRGGWRVPTHAEFKELIDNCTVEWTTMNGVKGKKFTSRKNGNSIFLPAAGGVYDTFHLFSGSSGSYWSSSLCTNRPDCVWVMGLHSKDLYTEKSTRCGGHSVRPVIAQPSSERGSGSRPSISKESVDAAFLNWIDQRGFSYADAQYQFLTDSSAVITSLVEGRNGLGMTIRQPIAFFYFSFKMKGVMDTFYLPSTLNKQPGSGIFDELERAFIPRDQMKSSTYKYSIFGKMTYENAMYYRFLYLYGLLALKEESSDVIKERGMAMIKTIKTGFWISKAELDDFGDPVGISLSCPFYSKRINNGNVEAKDVEFFLNITGSNIRIIPNPLELLSAYSVFDPFFLTIKDSTGGQIKCSLDKNLNITSNASSFLRIISRGGIVKGNITSESGRNSYVFSIYTNGYNAAKSSVKL